MSASASENTPSKNSHKGRPFDADGARTRENIIHGARECFARLGYASSTNKLIAETAGVSASNIYNYFPAKRDIYMAVVDEGEQYIAQAYLSAIEQVDSALLGIEAIFEKNIEIYELRPDLPPFFGHIRSEAIRHKELQELMLHREQRIRPILRGLVEQAQAEGQLSHDHDAESIEMMLFSTVLGLSLMGLQMDKTQHVANIRAFLALLSGNLISRG